MQPPQGPTGQSPQSINQAELLRAACCVAGTDGKLTEGEMRLLRTLKDRAGVGEASFQAMLERARNDPDYHEDVLDVIRPDAEKVVHTLARVAAADGNISDNQRGIIHALADRLGLEKDRVQQALAAADDER